LVDAEGEGILGEFTFTGKPFEQDADGNKPELVGASTGASNGADVTDDGADDAGTDTADSAE
jgi:ATP-dependent Clp protease ATP-binding subunit ClpC